MKSIVSSLLFFSLYLPNVLKACTCPCTITKHSLCEVLRDDPQTVVLQAILLDLQVNPDHPPFRYRLRVLENLSHQSTEDTLQVIVDDTCSEPLWDNEGHWGPPSPGDTLVFMGQLRTDTPPDSIQTISRFSCTTLPLYYRNGWVEGPFSGRSKRLTIADLRDYLRSDLTTDRACELCDCACFHFPSLLPADQFCTVVLLEQWELIVSATIVAREGNHGYRVSVDNVILGESNGEPELLFWTAPWSSCRADGAVLEVGQSYVLALSELTSDDWLEPEERVGDYELYGCGVYALPIVDGRVEGPITAQLEEASLDEFTTLVRGITDLNDCGLIDVAVAERSELELTIFPNPTSGILHLEAPPGFLGKAQIRLYTTTGRVLFAGPLPHGDPSSLDLNRYTTYRGVLILELRTAVGTTTQKVLKI
ncbi:MAG: T9SS type A sorting domain-containing protein [Bacteroidota bacterium]